MDAVVALFGRASPGFPRRHANPEDYLRRTLARSLYQLHCMTFPSPRAHCVPDLDPW